jgi:histone deacetylase 11
MDVIKFCTQQLGASKMDAKCWQENLLSRKFPLVYDAPSLASADQAKIGIESNGGSAVVVAFVPTYLSRYRDNAVDEASLSICIRATDLTLGRTPISEVGIRSFIAYNPNVNFTFPGMSYFNPANLRKYEQAKTALTGFGVEILGSTVAESTRLLGKVHQTDYLRLALAGDASTFARATEVKELKYSPQWVVRLALGQPMLAAVGLTIDSAICAWKYREAAIVLGGGFHHAKPGKGEGFCLLNDVAAAVHAVREFPNPPRCIAYIDLDAHMGNGVAYCFLDDSSFKIFDVYMKNHYPAADEDAVNRLDYGVAIGGADTEEYLYHVEHCLPAWLKLINPDFIFANVGQDVLASDPLTDFTLTIDDIMRRDRALARAIADCDVPAVFVAGGGYTKDAGVVLANTAKVVTGVYRNRKQ